LATAVGASPGRVVVVGAPTGTVVVDVSGGRTVVVDMSPAGAAPLSGAAAGLTLSAWLASRAARAAWAEASLRAPLPPQVAARIAAPRHRTPSSRSCSTSRRVSPLSPRVAALTVTASR
jgi:hypothetical protein